MEKFWEEITNALSNDTIPDPLRPPLPQDWGSQPQPKTAVAIISGVGKATDCNFGRYIHRVHANKTILKLLEKGSVGVSMGLPKFCDYPVLSQEWVKLRTNFKFCTHIHRIERNKSPLKFGQK